MYEYGEGVPQNYKTAFIWYSLAHGQADDFLPVQVENCCGI